MPLVMYCKGVLHIFLHTCEHVKLSWKCVSIRVLNYWEEHKQYSNWLRVFVVAYEHVIGM